MAQQDAKYQKVVDWLRENIKNGTFQQGEKLMSEMELSEKFSLSRQTIRHATGTLVEEKLLTRVQGSGTYIGYAPVRSRREHYGNVAVISTFYESYIFPPTLKGIEHVLGENGYAMQVSFTDNHIAREAEILKNLLEKDNVDGLIIEPAKSALPNPNLQYYEEIRKKNIPMICFNASYPKLQVPCVRIDDTRIASKATKLLLENGHRHIAAIFKSDDGQGELRYAGYLQAIREAGLSTSQDRVVWIDTPMMLNMEELSDHIFRRIGGCSGLVCYNDEVAYRLIELALKRGMKVPEDLSVVGIDDSYLAGVSRVPLTSFAHPKAELGKKVAENMIRMIEQPAFDGNYLFDSEPVLRESIADLRERSLT